MSKQGKIYSRKDFARLMRDEKNYGVGDAERFIMDFFEVIGDVLADGGTIEFANFGVFTTQYNRSRQGIDFATREKTTINPYYSIKFVPRKLLKEKVRRGTDKKAIEFEKEQLRNKELGIVNE